jgi:sulfatase maturation enzyme AslB (radical SAM superfamily)
MAPAISRQALSELLYLCQEDGFNRLQIKFAGGEPTLAEPVVISVCEATEELRSASSVSICLRMLTNGVFDTLHWIPIFRKYRIGVSISVDGAERP